MGLGRAGSHQIVARPSAASYRERTCLCVPAKIRESWGLCAPLVGVVYTNTSSKLRIIGSISTYAASVTNVSRYVSPNATSLFFKAKRLLAASECPVVLIPLPPPEEAGTQLCSGFPVLSDAADEDGAGEREAGLFLFTGENCADNYF